MIIFEIRTCTECGGAAKCYVDMSKCIKTECYSCRSRRLDLLEKEWREEREREEREREERIPKGNLPKLTKRQKEFLDFMREEPPLPTIDRICFCFSFRHYGKMRDIKRWIKALEKKKLVESYIFHQFF